MSAGSGALSRAVCGLGTTLPSGPAGPGRWARGSEHSPVEEVVSSGAFVSAGIQAISDPLDSGTHAWLRLSGAGSGRGLWSEGGGGPVEPATGARAHPQSGCGTET